MKIKIHQQELNKHIIIAQKGISSRSTMQILEGILIEAYNNKLKLTSTDLEIRAETYIDCNILQEGSIVVNSKLFGDIIRKLPSSLVEIEVNDNNVNIKCENSESNIIGNNPNDFPEPLEITDENQFKISKDLLRSAIRQTVFATSQDETRPALTGVLLEIIDNKASFVALDGYRLSLRNIPIKVDKSVKSIIPGRALNELNKILDNIEEVEIVELARHIVFKLGDTTLSSRLLDGQFINYKEIIREDYKSKVSINKKDFQDSLERASLFAREEKANLVKLNIQDDTLTIKSNTEIGNVNESLNIYKEGDNLDIAFNSKYLLDGIKAIDSQDIDLYFQGSLNPCIIKPVGDENYIYLVLPVRLAQEDY